MSFELEASSASTLEELNSAPRVKSFAKGSSPSALQIVRRLDNGQANLELNCPASKITLIQDHDTGCLLPYQRALSNLDEPSIVVRLNGEKYDSTLCSLVGFGEKLPEQSISAFFQKSGLSSNLIDTYLKRYELEQFSYLKCSQLNQTAARQLSLLSALANSGSVLLMNDPFQPFSGRWREHFAELLLQSVIEQNRLVVIVNLSFMPKVWQDQPVLNIINVSLSQERARKLAAEERAREKKRQEIEAQRRASQPESQIDSTIKFETADGKIAEIPNPILSNFKTTRDFIFEPLANLSRFLGAYSLPGFILLATLLLAIGAISINPDIRKKWLKMEELSKLFSQPQSQNIEEVQDSSEASVEEQSAEESAPAADDQNVQEPLPEPAAEILASYPQELDLSAILALSGALDLTEDPACEFDPAQAYLANQETN